MVQPKVPQCPKCGAPLARVGADWARRCSFCNADLTIDMPVVAAPRWIPPSMPQAPQPPPKGGAGIVFSLVAVVLVAAGTISFVGIRSRMSSNGLSNPFGGPDDFQWDSQERVAVVSVPGQAHEGFIGRLHRTADGSRTGPEFVYVSLFSGATFERVWTSAPLGRVSEDSAAQSAHFAVAGDRVVITDVRNVARVVDLATGRALSAVQLSDRADALCVTRAGAVWIDVSDEHALLLDVASGRASPAARPAECFPTRGAGYSTACGMGNGNTTAACVASESRAFAGMDTRALLTGPAGSFVAFGTRSPGTRAPMVAAIDARGAVTWQRPLPSGNLAEAGESPPDAFDVAGTTIVATYQQRTGAMRVVSLDATTGRTLWEAGVPRSQGSAPRSLNVGRERIYVPHWTWLDVLDRATGAHLRTVGRW
jgi:hypothetical protein